MLRRPRRSTLFPYTTLFRSLRRRRPAQDRWLAARGRVDRAHPLRDRPGGFRRGGPRSEEHTSELQSRVDLVCRLLLEKKKKEQRSTPHPRPYATHAPFAIHS